MKFSEIADIARKSDKRCEGEAVNLATLLNPLGLSEYDLPEDLDHPFAEVPLVTWLCTDTHVGWNMWFMGDTPVAITMKPCRKCDTLLTWLSDGKSQHPSEMIYDWFLKNRNHLEIEEETTILDEDIDIEDLMALTGANEYIINVFGEEDGD